MALCLLAGCARNGVLELTFELPASPRLSATELRVLSGEQNDFDSARWSAAEPQPLDNDRTVRVDIVAEGAAIEAPLALRLRLCDGSCTPTSPEVQVGIERAFYVGARTWVVIDVPVVPSESFDPIFVRRCEVGGCLEGDTASFCRQEPSMPHYCE
jgi:hypothetical protein